MISFAASNASTFFLFPISSYLSILLSLLLLFQSFTDAKPQNGSIVTCSRDQVSASEDTAWPMIDSCVRRVSSLGDACNYTAQCTAITDYAFCGLPFVAHVDDDDKVDNIDNADDYHYRSHDDQAKVHQMRCICVNGFTRSNRTANNTCVPFRRCATDAISASGCGEKQFCRANICFCEPEFVFDRNGVCVAKLASRNQTISTDEDDEDEDDEDLENKVDEANMINAKRLRWTFRRVRNSILFLSLSIGLSFILILGFVYLCFSLSTQKKAERNKRIIHDLNNDNMLAFEMQKFISDNDNSENKT